MIRVLPKVFTELGMVVHKVPRHADSKTIEVEAKKITFLRSVLNVTGGSLNTFFHAEDPECLFGLRGKTCAFTARVMYKVLGDGKKFYHIDYHFAPEVSAEEMSKLNRVVVTPTTLSALENGSDEWTFVPLPPPLDGTIVVMPQGAKLQMADRSIPGLVSENGIIHEMNHAVGVIV